MDEEIIRCTARCKSALVIDILRGKTTVAWASGQFGLRSQEVDRTHCHDTR
jgi:hypothetical protein